MTVVSTKEFNSNQEKYFNMAIDDKVFVKRGDYLFHLVCSNIDAVKEQAVLESDDDFHRAISAKEFREKLTVVLDRIDKKYANKCK